MTRKKNFAPLAVALWGLLFLLATPYVQPNNGGFGLAMPFNSTTWIVVALIITASSFQISAKEKLLFTRFDVLTLICFAVMSLPMLWSADPWRSYALDRYLALLALALLVLSQRQFSFTKAQKDLITLLVVSAGLLQSCLCLAQLFFGDGISWYYGPRLTGTMQQPNLAGSFIGTTLAVALYQYTTGNPKQFQALFLLSALAIGTGALALIMSRTGILGTSIALIVMTLLMRGRGCLKPWVAVSAGVLFASTMLSNETASPRDNLADPGYRTTLYSISLNLIKQKPLSGHGMGQFQAVYMAKQAKESHEFSSPRVAASHPHNELLFWGVEGGLLPVTALLFLGCWLTFMVWKHGQGHHKAMWIAAVPILLHTQTELPFYLSTPHLALFALLISQANPEPENQLNTENGHRLARFSVLLSGVVCAFMLSNLHAIHILDRAVQTPEVLGDMINPLAQEQRINEILGEVLAQQEDQASLNQAEALARHEVLIRPTALSYKILFDSLFSQGKRHEAAQVLAEGQKLFPGFTGFEERAQLLHNR